MGQKNTVLICMHTSLQTGIAASLQRPPIELMHNIMRRNKMNYQGARPAFRSHRCTFQGAICIQRLLQLLVDLPVEGAPDGADVGLHARLQVDLLAKLLNHEGLPHGLGICCMLLNPSLQEIHVPSLRFAQYVSTICP